MPNISIQFRYVKTFKCTELCYTGPSNVYRLFELLYIAFTYILFVFSCNIQRRKGQTKGCHPGCGMRCRESCNRGESPDQLNFHFDLCL